MRSSNGLALYPLWIFNGGAAMRCYRLLLALIFFSFAPNALALTGYNIMGLSACRLQPNFVNEVFQLGGYSYKYVVCGATTCQLWVYISGQWVMNGPVDSTQTNWAINSCTMPVPTCTAPQVLDVATNTCVTPAVPTCTAPQVLNPATNTCVCNSPNYLVGSVCTVPVTCTLPQVRDSATNTCVIPSCSSAGTVHSKGYFNVGVSPSGQLLKTACMSGCKIELSSGYTPAARSVINGTYYYFGQAEYKYVGVASTCNPDTPNFLANFVGSLPGQTCAAGQQMISMNGVTKCFDSSGVEQQTNSADAVTAAQTAAAAAQAATAAKAAQALTDAGTAIAGAGGTTAEQMAAKTVAAGLIASGGLGGSGSSTPTTDDPVMNQFCKDNPTSAICAEVDFGRVEDTSLTEKIINVSVVPVMVGTAGSCPAPTPMSIHGQTKYFQWTTYCNFATGVKPLLLVFAWLSAATFLVGGFKSE